MTQPPPPEPLRGVEPDAGQRRSADAVIGAPRIASLVPSVTELLVALGLGPCLVARTGYCVHPAEAVARVPKVGGTKNVNLAKLLRLAPTHVIVNVDENRRETVAALRGVVPDVLVTHPCAPEDVGALIAQIAAAFAAVPGVADRAAALDAELQAEMLATRPEGRAEVPVLYLIWREPWMTVARDTYIARLLARVELAHAAGARRRRERRGTVPGADRRRALVDRRARGAAVQRALRLRARAFAAGASARAERPRAAGRWRAPELVRLAHRGRVALPACTRRTALTTGPGLTSTNGSVQAADRSAGDRQPDRRDPVLHRLHAEPELASSASTRSRWPVSVPSSSSPSAPSPA